MPINLVAKGAGNRGSIPATLDGSTSNVDGTFANPAAFSGALSANTIRPTADFTGLFTTVPNRTGTIGTALGGVTSEITSNPDPYDLTLGGTRTIPFAYSWPTAPTTTSSATVTPATLSSNLVDGRAITLTAGDYGNVTINTTDQEFIIQSGVSITQLSFGASATRIKVSGDRNHTIRNMVMDIGCRSTDILVDGINCDDSGASGLPIAALNWLQGQRVAAINSSFSLYGYGIGAFPAVGQLQPTDTIIANCFCEGRDPGQSGNRVQGALRAIVVDNRFRKAGVTAPTFRLHAETGMSVENAFIDNNDFDGGRTAIQPNGSPNTNVGSIDEVWFSNNRHYYNESNLTCFSTNYPTLPQAGIIRITDNSGYGDTLTSYTGGASRVDPAWTDTGNTVAPYQSPPTWSFS